MSCCADNVSLCVVNALCCVDIVSLCVVNVSPLLRTERSVDENEKSIHVMIETMRVCRF